MTPATLTRVANGPRKTPVRSFTIPDEVYEAIVALAKENGMSTSKYVSEVLQAQIIKFPHHGSNHPPETPPVDTTS